MRWEALPGQFGFHCNRICLFPRFMGSDYLCLFGYCYPLSRSTVGEGQVREDAFQAHGALLAPAKALRRAARVKSLEARK